MAISDMKGTVTTTGMMDKGPVMPKGKVNPQLQAGGSQPLPEDPTKPVNPLRLNLQDQYYQIKK